MTAATVAPPSTVVTNEYQQPQQQQQREPEVLARRSASVRSSNHESKRLSLSSRDPSSLQRQNNSQSQTSTIGAGSMGKVKLAECLTDTDRQQVHITLLYKYFIIIRYSTYITYYSIRDLKCYFFYPFF